MTAAAGRLWVEDWLLPMIAEDGLSAPLDCLKLEPPMADQAAALAEVARLEMAGHRCMLAIQEDASVEILPFADQEFDLVLCGGFGRLAIGHMERVRLAVELARILRPSGHVLLHSGNRACPVDFSGNATLLHRPGDPRLLSLAEAEALFLEAAGFAEVVPLSPAGYQRWTRLPALARPLGGAVDWYLRHVATPRHRWLYASPLNPSLVLWLRR